MIVSIKRKIWLLAFTLFIICSVYWFFDLGHKPVEQVDELIGNNFDFAHKLYFQTNPDEESTFNIEDAKDEFRGIIQSYASLIKDSVIHEYTWKFARYNVTIWVSKTASQDHQIIDAIRWRKDLQF